MYRPSAGPDAAQHGDKVPVPQQDNELRQWFFASRFDTEEAWQSVVDYPGVSQLVQLRAKQQLARIYLHEDDFNRAFIAFDELAAEDDYTEIKAFGLAGKCVTLSLMERYADSAEVDAELWYYRDDLRDGEMEQLLQARPKEIARNWAPPRARSGTTGSKNISNQTRRTPPIEAISAFALDSRGSTWVA